MFCSSSVTVHLLRGLAAVVLLWVAFYFGAEDWLWTTLALVGALLLMRGCPSCWLIGLFETMARRQPDKQPQPD